MQSGNERAEAVVSWWADLIENPAARIEKLYTWKKSEHENPKQSSSINYLT